MKNLQEFITSNLDITEMDQLISAPDAAKRAARSLNVIAKLIDARYERLRAKVARKSLRDASFADAINSTEGRDAKTREVGARANPDYLKQRGAYEQVEATVVTLDQYIRLFENAHIFYRNLCKDIVE